jgi:hypothetical protein
MTRRLTVAAAALLALPVVAVWTPDASAFTTAKRLCVSTARRTLKNTLSTSRAAANAAYQTSLKVCFSDPGNGCVTQCLNGQTVCQQGPDPLHPGPAALKDKCSNSQDANDGVTSCLEQFDADTTACSTAASSCTGDPNTCANQQLTCAQNARLARFACQQSCAAQYQKALDTCSTSFNDCLEGCG